MTADALFSGVLPLATVMVAARLIGLVLVAPVIGDRAVPVKVRIALGLVIALALSPIIAHRSPAALESLLREPSMLLVAAGAEVAVGLALGFLARAVFWACCAGGEIVAHQMGIAAADILVPSAPSATSPVGAMYYLFVLVLFLLTNGHHLVLGAVAGSYEGIGVGAFSVGAGAAGSIASVLTAVLVVALKLAAPALVVLLLVEVAVGVLSRTTPQLNVLSVGFPIKILIGLLVSLVVLVPAGKFMVAVLGNWFGRLDTMLGGLAAP